MSPRRHWDVNLDCLAEVVTARFPPCEAPLVPFLSRVTPLDRKLVHVHPYVLRASSLVLTGTCRLCMAGPASAPIAPPMTPPPPLITPGSVLLASCCSSWSPNMPSSRTPVSSTVPTAAMPPGLTALCQVASSLSMSSSACQQLSSTQPLCLLSQAICPFLMAISAFSWWRRGFCSLHCSQCLPLVWPPGRCSHTHIK